MVAETYKTLKLLSSANGNLLPWDHFNTGMRHLCIQQRYLGTGLDKVMTCYGYARDTFKKYTCV